MTVHRLHSQTKKGLYLSAHSWWNSLSTNTPFMFIIFITSNIPFLSSKKQVLKIKNERKLNPEEITLVIYFETHVLNNVPLSRFLEPFYHEEHCTCRFSPLVLAMFMTNDSQLSSPGCICSFCVSGT